MIKVVKLINYGYKLLQLGLEKVKKRKIIEKKKKPEVRGHKLKRHNDKNISEGSKPSFTQET